MSAILTKGNQTITITGNSEDELVETILKALRALKWGAFEWDLECHYD